MQSLRYAFLELIPAGKFGLSGTGTRSPAGRADGPVALSAGAFDATGNSRIPYVFLRVCRLTGRGSMRMLRALCGRR